MCGLVFSHMLANGGIEAYARMNRGKAQASCQLSSDTFVSHRRLWPTASQLAGLLAIGQGL